MVVGDSSCGGLGLCACHYVLFPRTDVLLIAITARFGIHTGSLSGYTCCTCGAGTRQCSGILSQQHARPGHSACAAPGLHPLCTSGLCIHAHMLCSSHFVVPYLCPPLHGCGLNHGAPPIWLVFRILCHRLLGGVPPVPAGLFLEILL